MEAKISVFTEGLEAIKQNSQCRAEANKNKSAVSRRVGQLLSELFQVSVQVSTSDLSTIEAEINEYKNKLKELLTLDRTTNTTEVEKKAAGEQPCICKACGKKILLNWRTAAVLRPMLIMQKCSTMNSFIIRLTGMQHNRVYPQEESFKKAYALATKLIAGLGSKADVEKMGFCFKGTKIKDTQLPEAGNKDAALEKTFVDAFNKFHGEEFKGTAFKAVITSEDWSIERHEITGIVTGRIRRAVIVYKDKEGKCFLTGNFFLRQEYVGSSFTGAVQSPYPVMGSQQMLCENVK